VRRSACPAEVYLRPQGCTRPPFSVRPRPCPHRCQLGPACTPRLPAEARCCGLELQLSFPSVCAARMIREPGDSLPSVPGRPPEECQQPQLPGDRRRCPLPPAASGYATPGAGGLTGERPARFAASAGPALPPARSSGAASSPGKGRRRCAREPRRSNRGPAGGPLWQRVAGDRPQRPAEHYPPHPAHASRHGVRPA
jgi:hypothetical protein